MRKEIERIEDHNLTTHGGRLSQTKEKILEYLRENSEKAFTGYEIRGALGIIKTSNFYALLNRMAKKGIIEKRGNYYLSKLVSTNKQVQTVDDKIKITEV